jgi:hypothetical protein
MRLRAETLLNRNAAGSEQPNNQPIERDGDSENERECKADRFPKDCAQRRRQHLAERFGRIVEHVVPYKKAEVTTRIGKHKRTMAFARQAPFGQSAQAASIWKPCRA